MRRASILLLAALTLLATLVIPIPRGPVEVASANTGCPETDFSFGTQDLGSGDCTITTSTYWWNGTMTIAGNIQLDAPLNMNNMTIIFNMTTDEQYSIANFADLDITTGGIRSLNAYHWRYWDSTATATIESAFFNRSRMDFDGTTAVIQNSTFDATDQTASTDEGLELGPNSTFRWNLLTNWTLDENAAIFLYDGWGETLVWGNELHLECYGSNCMGIETLSFLDPNPTYSGFPLVEIAWNNITWEEIGVGDWAIGLDNEFTPRLYLHNNTLRTNATLGEPMGNCLQGGGLQSSIYEYNNCWGPVTYGIYDFIYEDSFGVTYQYNFFNDTGYAMVEFGNGSIRHNTFENVTNTPVRVCGDSDGACAGSSTNPRDFFWYNNTVSYSTGTDMARFSDENDQFNTIIQPGDPGSGVSTWDQDQPNDSHTVPGVGAWLYKTDQTIDRLQFANVSDGTRWVNLTIGGSIYPSHDTGFGATDYASLTIDGPIDQSGSMNINDDGNGTFLWALNPNGNTSFDLLSDGGSTSVTVENFVAGRVYNVTIWNTVTSDYENTSFTTNVDGLGSFTKTFNAYRYNLTLELTSSSTTITEILFATQDSYVDQCTPFTNYGSLTTLSVLSWSISIECSGNLPIRRAFLAWDISSVPEDAEIVSALAELYRSGGDPDPQTRTYEARAVTSSWAENTIAWSGQPGTDLADAVGIPVTGGTTGWYSWNVSNIFRGWHSGVLANYGLRIHDTIEGTGSLFYSEFHSSEGVEVPQIRLTIVWSYPAISYHGVLTDLPTGSDFVNATGLVIAYDGETLADSGVTLMDFSGEFNNGTMEGPTNTTSPFAGALGFDGTNDLVNTSYDLPTGSMSIGMWLYLNALPGAEVMALMSKRNADDEWRFVINTADRLSFTAYSATGVSTVTANGTTDLVAAVWYHIGLTWDGTDGSFFLNSTADGDFSRSGAAVQDTASVVQLGTDAYDVDRFLDGRQDEVLVATRVWSSIEIGSFYPDTYPPLINSSAADQVSDAAARLNGELVSLGGLSSVNVWFDWWSNPANVTETAFQSVSSAQTFNALLMGLQTGITYYFQSRVSDTYRRGTVLNFTTTAVTDLTIITLAATDVGASSAQFNGFADSNLTFNISFEWDDNEADVSNGLGAVVGSQTGLAPGTLNFNQDIFGLSQNTVYYYRAVGEDALAQVNGSVLSFTTGVSPTITTGAATAIGAGSAVLHGTLTGLGSSSTVVVSLLYCNDGDPFGGGPFGCSPLIPTTEESRTATGAFSFTLTGLEEVNIYRFRAQAVGALTTVLGGILEFRTVALTPPIVATRDATLVTSERASLNAFITSYGSAGGGAVSVYFRYGTVNDTDEFNLTTVQTPVATGNVSQILRNLVSNTTYYFQIAADGDGPVQYGLILSFNTSAIVLANIPVAEYGIIFLFISVLVFALAGAWMLKKRGGLGI